MTVILNFLAKKFGILDIYLDSNAGIARIPACLQSNAGIAQLVERNLAKVEVASSNLVSRSSL